MKYALVHSCSLVMPLLFLSTDKSRGHQRKLPPHTIQEGGLEPVPLELGQAKVFSVFLPALGKRISWAFPSSKDCLLIPKVLSDLLWQVIQYHVQGRILGCVPWKLFFLLPICFACRNSCLFKMYVCQKCGKNVCSDKCYRAIFTLDLWEACAAHLWSSHFMQI